MWATAATISMDVDDALASDSYDVALSKIALDKVMGELSVEAPEACTYIEGWACDIAIACMKGKDIEVAQTKLKKVLEVMESADVQHHSQVMNKYILPLKSFCTPDLLDWGSLQAAVQAVTKARAATITVLDHVLGSAHVKVSAAQD